MKIPPGTLVLVADGGRARVFRNVGEKGRLVLRQERLLEPAQMNDDGPSGSMPPEVSGEALGEATFAKQLARRLNAGALKGEYAHAVLMADPQTLGQIRPILHSQAVQRLLAEIARDMTNAPVEDIERALS